FFCISSYNGVVKLTEGFAMRLQLLSIVGILMSCPATGALAQGPQVASTVQLPTFSSFNVTTTVSVPDRGGMYLGGVDRGVDSTVNRGIGPLRNRGIGSSRTTSNVSVSATIIDNAELDRAVLAEA